MWSSIHQCPNTTCAFGFFTGCTSYSFDKGHPSFCDGTYTFNLAGKTIAWLEANRNLLEQGDEQVKVNLDRIRVAMAKDEKCVKTIDSILGRLNIWLSFGPKMMTVKCQDNEVSFPAQLFAPFKDPSQIFFDYKKEIVDLFINVAKGEPLVIPFGDGAKQLASLCKAMNYPSLHDIIWEHIVLRADKEELARIVINMSEQRNRIVNCCSFPSIFALNDEAIGAFQATQIKILCHRLNLKVGENLVFDFVVRWMKLQEETVNIEECIHFEHADFKWFDETFVGSNKYHVLMQYEKIILWSSYLNPHVKGKLPIEKMRGNRYAEKDFEGKKTLNVLERWHSTRWLRIKECAVLKGQHILDNRLFKKEWAKVSFDACTDEAVEDFILMQYRLPIQYRSFQTAKLLKDCGLTEQYDFWMKERIAKDKANQTELSWLQTLPEGIEIPEVIIDILCCDFLKRADNVELLRSVSASEFQKFLGNYKIWAMPQELLEVVEKYVNKYQSNEEKKGFFTELEKALTYKSCAKFCDLLKSKNFLSTETWFKFNTERARMKGYTNPPTKYKKVGCKIAYKTPTDHNFILISPEGIECTFALSLQPTNLSRYGRKDEYSIFSELKYVEGPPCTIAFESKDTSWNTKCKDKITMNEGMKVSLPHFKIRDRYSDDEDYKPKIEFEVHKKGFD